MTGGTWKETDEQMFAFPDDAFANDMIADFAAAETEELHTLKYRAILIKQGNS